MVDRGWPVGSLRLALSPNGPSSSGRNETIYSLTDQNGYARFSNLRLGAFALTVDEAGQIAETTMVEVTPNTSSNITVPLNWPQTPALKIRSISGILRGPDFYPQQTQVQLSLSLLQVASMRIVETTRTDSKGRFSFTDAPRLGTYLLRLNPSELRGWDGSYIEGMIPIAIDPKAARDNLDVDLGWSSCGLGYAQRPDYSDTKMSKLCGAVIDPEGAAIGKAQVILMANNGNVEVIEQSRTEENGNFDFSEQADGTYQLLIKSPGFQPFLQVIHVESSKAREGCQQPIHIRLGLLF